MENRIIKFRGKNIHTGEWLYGDYHREGKTHYITKPEQYLREYAPIEFIVDGKTIGQFTGLLDAKQKEIYEGDVLGCPEDDWFLNETVIFTEGCFMVKDGYTTTPMCAIDAQYRTVIGNIHDNPSLISDKQ